MIFSEGKGVNPLYLQTTDRIFPNLSTLLSLGKRTNFDSFLKGSEKDPENSLKAKHNGSFSIEKTPKNNFQITRNSEQTDQKFPSKTKDLSRWETFVSHSKEDGKVSEVSSLKTLWSYLMGRTQPTDLVSYNFREKKENLHMLVDEYQDQLTLYVFWKAEGFGPFGLFFKYEPDLKNPVHIGVVTTEIGTDKELGNQMGLANQFQNLLRDFPQIGSISFETWDNSPYNGDYR